MLASDDTLVRRAVEEIWNDQQLSVADELFAPTYINHGGLITDLIQGPEAIKTSVVLFRRAFPDLHLSIDDLTSLDGTTVLHWRARQAPACATSQPPTGHADGFTGVFRTWTVAGQIQESWTEWDQEDALTRLGRDAAGG